jgi:hypothetical protein
MSQVRHKQFVVTHEYILACMHACMYTHVGCDNNLARRIRCFTYIHTNTKICIHGTHIYTHMHVEVHYNSFHVAVYASYTYTHAYILKHAHTQCTVMYKAWGYSDLASIILDYKQSYERWSHKLNKIKVARAPQPRSPSYCLSVCLFLCLSFFVRFVNFHLSSTSPRMSDFSVRPSVFLFVRLPFVRLCVYIYICIHMYIYLHI